VNASAAIETYRKRSRRVTCRSPSPAAVEAKALVGNNLEETASPEGLRVGLTLDLEHVQWQKDNLSNTNHGTCGRVHDGFAGALSERAVEAVAVVLGEVVADERLAAKLVDSLENLLPSVSDRPSALVLRSHTL
jgi:hypothetical protein